MKKMIGSCGVLLSAFVCPVLMAADQSLTWTAGATPAALGANGELTFTYDANDSVQTLSMSIATGDTITLTGGDITFAADATIAATAGDR